MGRHAEMSHYVIETLMSFPSPPSFSALFPPAVKVFFLRRCNSEGKGTGMALNCPVSLAKTIVSVGKEERKFAPKAPEIRKIAASTGVPAPCRTGKMHRCWARKKKARIRDMNIIVGAVRIL